MGNTGSSHSVPSADRCRLSTLNVSVRGSAAPIRTNDGHCLGPRSGWSARNARNFSASNAAPSAEHQRRHHPVADGRIGDRVHRDLDDVGVAHQDALDRRGAEVLAVDAHPVAESAREIGVAVLVPVGEVAAVVHAAAHPLGFGLGIVVVARETGLRPVALTNSPIMPGGHGSPVSTSTISTPSGSGPSEPSGVSGVRAIATPPSVEPKPSTTSTPNRSANRVEVARRTLVAVHEPQRVVGVVGRSGVARM